MQILACIILPFKQEKGGSDNYLLSVFHFPRYQRLPINKVPDTSADDAGIQSFKMDKDQRKHFPGKINPRQ